MGFMSGCSRSRADASLWGARLSDDRILPDEIRELLFSTDGAPLRADVISWAKWRRGACASEDEQWAYLLAVFRSHSEFRSLFDYRLSRIEAFRGAKLQPGWPRATDLYIYCDRIGGGFRVQHGHSTWVMAQEIGANFHVNQNVTIGVGKRGKPTIGDNVSVFAGAVVTGEIRIGDNVTIAPNTFVNFDVDSDSYVFPAPAVVKAKSTSNSGKKQQRA